jgi:TonB family protein
VIFSRSPLRFGCAALAGALVLGAPPSAVAQPAPAATGADPDAPAKPVLTKPPRLVEFVEAPFPESERSRGAGASVVLEILISETGLVDAARVIGPQSPAFDAAALEAASKFRFEPAEIDGKPSAIKIQYRYEVVLEQAPPPETVLSGEVRRRGTGEPMAGVDVSLDTGETTVTDAQGRFELRGVSPGVHTVMLSGLDLAALQTEETIEAGQQVAVRYDVEPIEEVVVGAGADDMEIVVVAPQLTRQVVATRVEAESARRVAGTQGDVLKIVENMPGVARAAVGSGDVVVWGAAPEDTRVYVDGVRVPALYHFGGLRSVVHTDLVQSVELVPGAYGAGYGRGLGGLVTVDTRDPDDERLHESLQLDLLDASAAVSGAIGEDVRVAGAVRRSHLRDVLSGVSEDVEEFFPIPQYYDASARLRYEPSNAEWVEVGGLLSGDSVTRRIGSDDPAERRSETREIGFDRIFVRYRNEPGDGSRVTIVPWFGRDRSRLDGQFGSTPVSLEVDSTYYGLRAAWSGAVTSGVTLNTGMDIEVQSASGRRQGSVSAPPREGDARVFGQPPADQVNADDWHSTTGSAAPYAEADIALVPDRLFVTPGLRLEPFFTSVNRRRPAESSAADVGAFSADLSVQPRLATRFGVTPALTLKAAYGRYRQPARAEDLSSVFGNPLLGTAQASHYLVGGDLALAGSFGVEATVFYSRSSELPVRNPLPSPAVAETLLGLGEGRSYGMQLLLRRNLTDGLFGWLAYTLQRSERKDAPDAEWRLFDYDQTHVLTALVSYDLGAGFDIGARLRVASGYPRTPVTGAYYDARRDRYEPELGPKNEIRIPTFWQADVRASKRWSFAGSELEAYLDVQNVTNHDNAEEIVYAPDYSERRYIRGLPILPVLGATWSF